MFCTKCGSTLPDGTKFCPYCGQKMDAPAAAPVPEAPAQSNPVPPVPEQNINVTPTPVPPQAAPVVNPIPTEPTPKKKSPVGIILTVLVLLLVAILGVGGFILWNTTKATTIHLNDYVTVSFEGYETLGTATLDMDYDAYGKALAKALKIKDSDYERLDTMEVLVSAKLQEIYNEFNNVKNMVTLTLSQSTNLSNGDEVTVHFNMDNETAKEHKVQFKGEDMTFTVSGLESIQIIDPFENLTAEFSGIAPNGTFSYQYDGNFQGINSYDFYADKTNGLSNGDVVTVTISTDDTYLLKQGCAVKSKTKEFTVTGLDHYVTDANDLTAEFIQYAKSEAEDSIVAYTANSYNENSKVKDLTYAGYFLLTKKEANGWGSFNEYYMIYKGTVTNTNFAFPDTVVYFPIKFTEVMATSNGVTSNREGNIIGTSQLGNNYHTNGYSNPLLCYIELASSKVDSYNVTAGDGMEVFANYSPIQSISDLSAESIQMLKDDTTTTLITKINADYDKEWHANNFEFYGLYLLTAKNQGNDFRSNNQIYVIYRARVSTDRKNDFEPTMVYYPVEYTGLVNLPNGEFMYSAKNGIIGNFTFSGHWWSTFGYNDQEDMYNDLISVKRDRYTYEVSLAQDELQSVEENTENTSEEATEEAQESTEESTEETTEESIEETTEETTESTEESSEEFSEADTELVTLTLTDAGVNKIQVIKEIRTITGLGLKDAKDLADNTPSVLLESISAEDAASYQEQLEALGATVTVE